MCLNLPLFGDLHNTCRNGACRLSIATVTQWILGFPSSPSQGNFVPQGKKQLKKKRGKGFLALHCSISQLVHHIQSGRYPEHLQLRHRGCLLPWRSLLSQDLLCSQAHHAALIPTCVKKKPTTALRSDFFMFALHNETTTRKRNQPKCTRNENADQLKWAHASYYY